jgi:hypothetical protein
LDASSNKFDGDRVERYFCWDEELRKTLGNVSKTSNIYPKEDRLDMVIDAEIWKDRTLTVHLALKNRHPEGVPQTL